MGSIVFISAKMSTGVTKIKAKWKFFVEALSASCWRRTKCLPAHCITLSDGARPSPQASGRLSNEPAHAPLHLVMRRRKDQGKGHIRGLLSMLRRFERKWAALVTDLQNQHRKDSSVLLYHFQLAASSPSQLVNLCQFTLGIAGSENRPGHQKCQQQQQLFLLSLASHPAPARFWAGVLLRL